MYSNLLAERKSKQMDTYMYVFECLFVDLLLVLDICLFFQQMKNNTNKQTQMLLNVGNLANTIGIEH